MSSVFSPKAGKQATGVEGVRAYYLVVSAWPVPTYLDCKCSSCACCEYLSCDVIRAIECAVCVAHTTFQDFHIHMDSVVQICQERLKSATEGHRTGEHVA